MSKRDIQQRMYREAAEVYQQYLQQDISSLDGFDPLVKMLIDACADELAVLETEVEASEIRILKTLAQLLTPDAYLGPLPAHGIVHLPSTETSGQTDFLTDTFLYSSPRDKKLYFTPAGNYDLLSGQVRYMAHGAALSVLSHGVDTEVLLRSKQNLPPQTIWIGLELAQESLNQKQISFYFNIPFEKNFRSTTELLATSTWKAKNTRFDTSPGLQHHVTSDDEKDWTKFHLIRSHEHNIRAYYENQFLTIQCPAKKTLADFAINDIPVELANYFYKEELEKSLSDSKLVWFEVSFADSNLEKTKLSDILKRLVVQVNCFPILNRRIYRTPFALNQEFNLFPLQVKAGNYYGIESIRTSNNKYIFVERPFSVLSDPNYNSNSGKEMLVYAVRKEGVQRFDKRTALDWMDNILRITREESLVYNALGKNILTSNVKNIQQSINDINAKLNQTKAEEDAPQKVFLAFPAITLKENQAYVIATYWSTDGNKAQNIPSGEEFILSESKHQNFSGSSARLLTTTVGGRSPLLNEGHLSAFRSALVVRDKIVTEEDIRIYCHQKLGADLKSVHISKGVAIGIGDQEGFIRVLKVTLELNINADDTYLMYLKNKLEVELNAKSASYLPVHVDINPAN